MKNLLILGAGQYGQVVKETAETMDFFDKIDFLDDNNPLAIGRMSQYEKFYDEYRYAIVALGDANLRHILTDKLEANGFLIPSIIHSSAVISKSAKIGEGCIIEANTTLNTQSVLSKGVIVSAGAVVNHNAQIEEYCHIDASAVVSAGAIVKANTVVKENSVYR